jgi:trigger factor
MSDEIKKTLVTDEELTKIYEINIGVDLVNRKVDENAQKRQKTYKMDGFRPGKVPLNVIKKREGTALFFSIAEELINTEIFAIVDENKYELASNPDIKIKTMDLNKDISLDVEYILLPQIPDLDLKTIGVKEYNIRIDETEVEKSIERILKNFKDWSDKDDIIVVGDTAKINFLGKINGEAFDGGKGEDYPLEIGSHSFIDNFEDQLVGKRAGDKVLVSVKFPDNYHSTKLAGKQAEFDVEITKVLSPKEPILDDDFTMKNFGVETVEDMKEVIRKDIAANNSTLSKNKVRNDLVEQLSKILKFNIPKKLIETRFQEMLKSTKEKNLRSKKEEEIDENKLREEAEDAVRLGLFLSEICKEQNITVSKNEVDSAIIKNAMMMKGYEQFYIDFYKKNSKMTDALRAELLENKIIDYIIENSSREIIDISLEDFNKLR